MENYKDLNPIEDIIDKEEENRIFTEMARVDGLQEYFRLLMSRDMKMNFSALTSKEQDMCHGAFYRMEWLSKKLKSNSLDNKL